jgi:protein TonB
MKRHWIAPLLLLCALTVSAASQVHPQRIRVSSGVMQALLVKKVPPQYPQDAKDQHIEGVVVLKINTDKEGNVYQAELVSGHPQLAPAAIEAVKQWKYKPYQLNGWPVEVESQVQINFTLVN